MGGVLRIRVREGSSPSLADTISTIFTVQIAQGTHA